MAELIVTILIEFGFNLSATRSIARHRDEPVERGRVIMGVLSAQAILAVIGIGAALIASRFIPLLRDRPALLAAGLIYAVAQGFMPFWYFQGMERIRLAALIEISGKTAALGALFVFVRSPHDAWRAIAIQAVSPAVFVCIGLSLACARSTCLPQLALIPAVLEEGWHMFVFRASESIYGVANAFLLGVYRPPVIVGYFGAAEKISARPPRASSTPSASRCTPESAT